MSVLSRVAFDARADATAIADLPVDAELRLRHTTHITAEAAAKWAQKRPEQGRLTALVDLPDAARLNVTAWLDALKPDVVELRTPAWSEAGMAAIGWPAGQDVLRRVLTTLAEANVETRLALHVSSLTLPELNPATLDLLAQETELGVLTVVLWPVLGAHAPRLDVLAQAAVALWQSGHALTASRLLPACALPESIDGEATFASERAAAKQDFTAQCEACPAREAGRCDGVAVDLLAPLAAAGVTWAGWETLAADRAPVELPDPLTEAPAEPAGEPAEDAPTA